MCFLLPCFIFVFSRPSYDPLQLFSGRVVGARGMGSGLAVDWWRVDAGFLRLIDDGRVANGGGSCFFQESPKLR